MQPIYHHPSEITTTRAETAEGFLQQSMRQFELASPFVSRIIGAKRKLAHIGPDLEKSTPRSGIRSGDYRNPHRGTGADRESQKCYGSEETKKLLRRHIMAKKQDLLEPDIIDNILYRYALNSGDQLGGG